MRFLNNRFFTLPGKLQIFSRNPPNIKKYGLWDNWDPDSLDFSSFKWDSRKSNFFLESKLSLSLFSGSKSSKSQLSGSQLPHNQNMIIGLSTIDLSNLSMYRPEKFSAKSGNSKNQNLENRNIEKLEHRTIAKISKSLGIRKV